MADARRGIFSGLMQRLHAPVYASRLAELVRRIAPRLEPGDSVLDVGCGSGALGRAIMDSPECPADVKITGLERHRRGDEPIPVEAYDGKTIPYPDASFSAVILADVLHHEADPLHLIRECARVARRTVIIKDHKIEGFLARPRICLLDWAANAPYGVTCLYRYNTLDQWRKSHTDAGLVIDHEVARLRLYPFPYNLVFTAPLQYLVFLRVHRV